MDILAHPTNCAARDVLVIYREVLRAVAADNLVWKSVRRDGDSLYAGPYNEDLRRYRSICILGAGKASVAMARALVAILGDRVSGGVVVTKRGHAEPVDGLRVMEAGHPVPDESSVRAGEAIAAEATKLTGDDLALVVLSGGASALMELPTAGITLTELQHTTDVLLRCGATIDELNAVRCRLSDIKAGGLARLIAPARGICLVLSDVLGNRLDVIGSGPCWTSGALRAAAPKVMEKYGLADQLPPHVVDRLRLPTGPEEHANETSARIGHVIIGDIRTATEAAKQAAQDLGHRPLVLTNALRGEAREIGTLLGGMAVDLPELCADSGTDCLILGGEPTVTVQGDGKGGRCTELASAAALCFEDTEEVAMLAAGTDGTDGPTDAAGALVDGATAREAREAGHPLPQALKRSDTYTALDRIGRLIRTGPTGSNVGDVVIALFAPERSVTP